MGNNSLNWLQEEACSRMKDQADAWLAKPEKGLFLRSSIASGLDALCVGGAQWVCAESEALFSFEPSPCYDIAFIHVLPSSIEQQTRLWLALSFVLTDGAGIFFSAWCGDTAQEIRRDASVDTNSVAKPFADLQLLGDSLAQAGFSDAVMSTQSFQVTYDHADAIKHDLVTAGVMSTADLAQLGDVCVSKDSSLVLSYELALGHAVFSQAARDRQMGVHSVSIDAIKGRK